MARFNASTFVSALVQPAILKATGTVLDSIMQADRVRDGLLTLQQDAVQGLGEVASELDPRRILQKQLTLEALLTGQRKAILVASQAQLGPDAQKFLDGVLGLATGSIVAASRAFTAG